MQSTGTDILKIVTTATNMTDVSQVFQLIPHCQVPVFACATGDKGLISQLLGPKFGGYLIYSSIGSGKDSTPGQCKLLALAESAETSSSCVGSLNMKQNKTVVALVGCLRTFS